MNFVNTTPHTVNVVNSEGNQVAVFPADPTVVARLEVTRQMVGIEDGGIEIYVAKFGEPSPLPPEEDGVGYIVSALYATGLRAHGDNRQDIFVPGEAKRNEAKQIVGCIGLSVA